MKLRPITVAFIIVALAFIGGIIYAIFGDSLDRYFSSVEDRVAEDRIVDDRPDGDADDMFASDTSSLSEDLKALEEENKARLLQGCFGGKDCIPSIDDPKFVSVEEAESAYLNDEDWVIGLYRNGEARAYPLKILNWHEIVNDTVGGEAIAISFCPLCFTGNAFLREVGGEVTTFGVSGYLLNSNLVMYDRLTDSLWEQITGEAIVGSQIGDKLKKITVGTMPWPEWKEQHPNTIVLSTETGHNRDYQHFPYGDYNTTPGVYFPLEHEDSTLPEKELVYGVLLNGKAKAYVRAALDATYPDGGEFDDEIGGQPVKVKWENTILTITDSTSGEELVPEIGFWFSWVAFYVDTEIYGLDKI